MRRNGTGTSFNIEKVAYFCRGLIFELLLVKATGTHHGAMENISVIGDNYVDGRHFR